ncbi:hypothetical protein KAS45_00195, partial [candidate division WOR-3 bacterium]|nr:hypothetical protein [candidate division WOR-3 bacterium]
MSELLLVWTMLLNANHGLEYSQDLTRFYEIAVATDPDYDDYYQAGIYRLARGEPGKSVELLEQV